MQLGILFSGQGAQKPGMGCDLLADETFSKTLEQASEAAELDIVKLLKSENGELNQTRYWQLLAWESGTCCSVTCPTCRQLAWSVCRWGNIQL